MLGNPPPMRGPRPMRRRTPSQSLPPSALPPPTPTLRELQLELPIASPRHVPTLLILILDLNTHVHVKVPILNRANFIPASSVSRDRHVRQAEATSAKFSWDLSAV